MSNNESDRRQQQSGESEPESVDDIAVGDSLQAPPQAQGTTIARSLLSQTSGDASSRAQEALQQAKLQREEAMRELRRARRLVEAHDFAVKSLEQTCRDRHRISEASNLLNEELDAETDDN